MVSKGEGGISFNRGSDSSGSDTDVSDSHLDDLVDDLIGKLSIYPSFSSKGMTIKNRKDRVKPDRQPDWDTAGTSTASARHTHTFKPYSYPDERKDCTGHRSRIRPAFSHDSPTVKEANENKHAISFSPYPLLDNTAYQTSPAFPRGQSRLLPASQPSDGIDECLPSPHDPAKVPVPSPPSTDRDNGNNSEDEYCPGIHVHRSSLQVFVVSGCTSEYQNDETNLEKLLMEKKGWKIVQVKADGACLFRSVSHQIFGDEEKHSLVRSQVVDYMLKNKEHFSPYITEEFDHYISRKRDPTCYGNHVEIQAIAELYNRPVEIYHDSVEPINVFHADYSKEFPIRLSYHGRVHYNSVVDPFNPSFGCGLGMPNYQPALAEPDLIAQAIQESETTQLEETLMREKLAETEQSEIERCIEAQVVRESYLDYLKQLKIPPPRKTGSSSESTPLAVSAGKKFLSVSQPVDVASSSNASLPCAPRSSGAMAAAAQSASSHRRGCMPAEMRGMDEDAIVAMVMEQSRQEYVESLRNRRSSPTFEPQECHDSAEPPNDSSKSPNVHYGGACKK
ncbi:unnamed protein product [Calicophoron daubneyi]|uniref:ubiquitinyl hydrolase 1 n=1 Tax=Calicophoron daubneyi TaxID=300641 RepID=A0AAV2T2C2_CALDB